MLHCRVALTPARPIADVVGHARVAGRRRARTGPARRDGRRRDARRRRLVPVERRTVASAAPAPAVRAGRRLHAGAAASGVVRPPRLRRRRPGLPWSRRLGGARFDRSCDEGPDGAATIEWAAGLPFCDGQVITYGFSYQGLAQLYAAARRPPALRGVAAMMCCPRPVRGLDVRGRLPAPAVRHVLERTARRSGGRRRASRLRRRRAPRRDRARCRPAAVVRRVAGAPTRRRLLGGAAAGPPGDRRPGVHGAGLLRRLLVGHRPADRGDRCRGGVRAVGAHAVGNRAPRRRSRGRRRPARGVRARWCASSSGRPGAVSPCRRASA